MTLIPKDTAGYKRNLIMTAPSVQLSYNDSEVRIFWDFDSTGVYSTFNLYWSAAANMAGEAQIARYIPNNPDRYFSNKSIFYKFNRATLGLTVESSLYLRLKGVNASGVEDASNPGVIRYLPSLSEQISQNKAVEMHGFDYTNKIWRKLKTDATGSLI